MLPILLSPYTTDNFGNFQRIVYEYSETFELVENYSLRVPKKYTTDYIDLLSMIVYGHKNYLEFVKDSYIYRSLV